MGHARLSPSSAHRWMNCPGSLREEAKYPVEPGGPAAVDGTHTHTVLEQCLVGERGPDEFVGMELSDHEGSFTVDQERADRVKVALGYIYARQAEIPGPVAIREESKVNPGALIGRDDCTGTADCILVGDTEIEIIDYKDGMSPVFAENNWQMKLYALGVIREYTDHNREHPFEKIRLTIIQPKVTVKGLPAVNSWDATKQDVDAWTLEFHSGAWKTDQPDAPLIPGDSQCKWCRAKPCAALTEKAMADAQILFGQVEGISQQAADNDPKDLTDGQIVEILEAAPLIREFLKSVEDAAYKKLDSGKSLPGLKLVRGRGSRGWALPEEEIATKLKNMGIPKEVIYPPKLISVAQIEKANWVKKSKGEEVKASLTPRQLKKIEENYVKKSTGKLQVALESDAREAVVRDTDTLFKDVKPAEEQPALPAWLQ